MERLGNRIPLDDDGMTWLLPRGGEETGRLVLVGKDTRKDIRFFVLRSTCRAWAVMVNVG